MVSTALSVVAGLAGGIYVEWSARREARRQAYEAALTRAVATGKPLLVVGDPGGGWTRGDYGYGDACLDMSGCPNAPGHVTTIKSELGSGRIPFEDDSCVVFVCYVLEYVDDIERATAELQRVAGRKEDLLLLTLGAGEVAAWTYPGARWIVERGKDGEVVWSPIERRRVIEARIRGRSR